MHDAESNIDGAVSVGDCGLGCKDVTYFEGSYRKVKRGMENRMDIF